MDTYNDSTYEVAVTGDIIYIDLKQVDSMEKFPYSRYQGN